jgi:hypothetical protein
MILFKRLAQWIVLISMLLIVLFAFGFSWSIGLYYHHPVVGWVAGVGMALGIIEGFKLVERKTGFATWATEAFGD